MLKYLLIIEGEQGDYGAFFPDLPGVCAFAENKNALLERATRAGEDFLRHNVAPHSPVRSEVDIEDIVSTVQQSRPVCHTMVYLDDERPSELTSQTPSEASG